ncbi:MAG: hypothetical protein LBN09_01130 [Clostridioides sp.]|jgi:hypothetical protein|nr:hypothetical protein [Clostridioides sp.]
MKRIAFIASISGVIALSTIVVFSLKEESSVIDPTIYLDPPAPISANSDKEFEVALKMSDLPDEVYPGASISIGFDNSKLEFVGLKPGTMQTSADKLQSGSEYEVPTWNCNIDVSNKNGQINAMYLDMSDGNLAYNRDGFKKDKRDVVLKLVFKLNVVQRGDTLDLNIDDAVFATVDRSKSLAIANKKLEYKDCKIVVM